MRGSTVRICGLIRRHEICNGRRRDKKFDDNVDVDEYIEVEEDEEIDEIESCRVAQIQVEASSGYEFRRVIAD